MLILNCIPSIGSVILSVIVLFSLESGVAQPDSQDHSQRQGISILPILAANSTYGLMIGGAGFYHFNLTQNQFAKTSVTSIYTQNNQYLHGAMLDVKGPRWVKGISFSKTNFFDSHFPDTKKNYPYPPDQINATEVKSNVYGAFRHTKNLSTTFIWKQRTRVSHMNLYLAREKRYLPERVYPDEVLNLFGFASTYDRTYEMDDKTIGTVTMVEALRMPGINATNLPQQPPFTKLTIDIRNYSALLSDLVIANRLYAGNIYGKASYLSLYRLGGQIVRGYRYSRLKGTRIYAFQSELRYPLWGWLSGSTFMGVGNIGHNTLEPPALFGYGIGFHLSLPPDHVAMVRLDIGMSQEKSHFTMQANHAF